MRENSKSKKYIALAALLCAASIVAMLIATNIHLKPIEGDFIPPEFEAEAVEGEPDVSKELGFIEPYAEGMTFHAGVCGELNIYGDTADIYFTNKKENEVWLMLRITDEQGKALAQTGILRPGEYVKTIKFQNVPANGQRVIYKIMAYEPETYFSMGYFKIKTLARNN